MHTHYRQHRTEDLFLVDRHIRLDVVEQRAADIEAVLMAGYGMTAAIGDQRRALLHTLGDIAFDLGLVRTGHQRAHLGIGLHAVADLQRARAFREARHQLVGDIAHRYGDRDRHAAFAGRTIRGTDQRIDRLVEIGIRHHHQVVLGAAQGLHALAVLGPFRIDVLGDRRRADERQRLDVWMREQRVHGFLVALHDIEHAIGQSRLAQQIGNQQARRRIALRRLQHEGIAAGDCHREHPHRHHHREVERRDAGHHAQRLAQVPVVDAAADVVGEIGLEQVGDAAGEFHHLDAARDFAPGVREHLAVLARDQRGQVVVVLVEQFLELEQDARAAQRRRVGPGGERGLGGGDGIGHVLRGP